MPNRAPSLRRDSPRPSSPRGGRHSTEAHRRPSSSSSTGSSTSSNLTSLSVPKRSPYQSQPQTSGAPRSPSTMQGPNSSNTSLPNFSRPSAPFLPQNEPLARRPSPLAPSQDVRGHRPRQHSQGFFEPSLPTASMSEHNQSNLSNLTASQIAAQTAVAQSFRNRAQSIPATQDNIATGRKNSGQRESPPPIYTGYQGRDSGPRPASPVYQNGVAGGRALAATTAANVAFPRNPNLPHPPPPPADHAQESGHKHKGEKSKMKLFSKPKHIGISRDKGGDQRDKALPSPNKLGLPGPSGLSRMMNASTTSLNEMPSSNSSMYNQANSSATTVVLAERPSYEKEREKEKDKHKHHFLSRQKLKLKDKDEHRNLPLSSASSNSKPLDPNAPQSLYSFAPSSPSTTSFSKSKSGLDLRHGGRALREKKREEKASAAASELDHADWIANGVAGAGSSTTLVASTLGNSSAGVYADHALKDTLQGFGLQNMTPEDAWDFLKAKLIVLFEGEDIRIALEDLNKLVSIHIQRCVREKMPFAIVEDLRDLLQTGFSSLNHSIHSVPDERLVPHLAQMWLFVFGTVLPFIQAVFFPLDLEFKGRGSIMTSREAKEFWGALPNGESSNTSIGDELDVRTIVLVSFRDTIILSRYEALKAIFSRLSLDSINANVSTTSTGGSSRPSTASTLDPGFGSYNSQSSTLFNAPGSYSSESALSRSRAASNTSSNPDNMIFQSSYANVSPPSSSRGAWAGTGKGTDPSLLITETVGRMLQCISVLASVQSDDDAQRQIETLSKTLKHNWLGRGRTGRDRRGFVGTRVRPPVTREEDTIEGVGRAGIMGTGLFRDRSNSEAAHAVLVNGR